MNPLLTKDRIAIIRRIVAEYFCVAESSLNVRVRKEPLCTIRHCAMFLANEFTQATRNEIGEAFNRHHSDVTHGILSFKRLLDVEEYWRLNLIVVTGKVKEALKNEQEIPNQTQAS